MLGGDGGIGKSLVAQQLLTAAAIGQRWLELPTRPCKGIGFFCEDDDIKNCFPETADDPNDLTSRVSALLGARQGQQPGYQAPEVKKRLIELAP